MKVNKSSVTVGSVSILLGIILALTFKTVSVDAGPGGMSSYKAQQVALELKKERDLNAQLKQTNDDLEKKIDEYENIAANKDSYVKSLYSDAMLYRTLAGYTDIHGEGLIIEITDPKIIGDLGESLGISGNVDMLLKITSTLNAAGAEAIAINDQRITSYTEIERVSDYLVINGVPMNTPIIIKAIGKSDYLNSALNIKGGMVDQLRYYNFNVNIIKDEDVTIPKTTKPRVFKYATPVEVKEG